MEEHKNCKINLKYTCKICGSAYGRLFALTDHIKTAHPENGDSAENYLIEESQEMENEQEVYEVTMASDV